MKKLAGALLGLAVLLIPGIASAHVVVTPASANVGADTTFSISVPNEKDIDVTALSVDIPGTVKDVTPTVKAGWTIMTDKTGEGDSAVVTSISWTAGSIPAGQRDDFTFQAQAPATTAEIDWKAHQTYADGTVVNWDRKPAASESESATSGPYSVTKVIDDLSGSQQTTAAKNSTPSVVIPTILGALALLSAIVALFRTLKAPGA